MKILQFAFYDELSLKKIKEEDNFNYVIYTGSHDSDCTKSWLIDLDSESFNDGYLDYPNYTRPEEFRGMRVPDVLLSGHHKNIEKYRQEEKIRLTNQNRKDLVSGDDNG